MKKRIALALCIALAVPTATPAFAAELAPTTANSVTAERESGYELSVDGKDTGSSTCIMVSLRAIAEPAGFTVTWNGDGTVGVDKGVMHTTVTLGQDLYQVVTSVEGLVGMSAPFSLGAAPFVIDGTTYVPMELFNILLGNRADAVTVQDGSISILTYEAEGTRNPAQIPNPFLDCGTLAEAEMAAGFPLKLPETVGGIHSRQFRAIEGDLLEVLYLDGDTVAARIRKAPGTGDISGDNTSYPEAHAVFVSGVEVTVRGENNQVRLATWVRGGYTYAVSLDSPISSADMVKLVSEIQ